MLIALVVLLLVAPAAPVTAAKATNAGHWWKAGRPLPKLTGRVVDDAHLLTAEQQAGLTGRLAKLEAATGHQFVIVTVPSLNGEKIEDFGIRLGRTWAIGRKNINDGVLLIVAPNERKVRIEVGYGLEKPLSDPVCAKIIRDVILPRFRARDLAGGIEAGAASIVARIGGRKL